MRWRFFGPDNAIANLAKNKPATQSSVSEWSNDAAAVKPVEVVLGGKELAEHWKKRADLLSDPLLDFDSILITKRVPGSYTHMSDQYLGWWSRPGGGIYILRDFKSDTPALEHITKSFTDPGNFLRPALSYDAKKVLFAWCKYYPEVAGIKNKLDKGRIPEDSFYHLYEMGLDGSVPRQLTFGKYNDFDGRYLPDGGIVFLSTRRGQAIQVGRKSAALTLANDELPEVYVRCGGGAPASLRGVYVAYHRRGRRRPYPDFAVRDVRVDPERCERWDDTLFALGLCGPGQHAFHGSMVDAPGRHPRPSCLWQFYAESPLHF